MKQYYHNQGEINEHNIVRTGLKRGVEYQTVEGIRVEYSMDYKGGKVLVCENNVSIDGRFSPYAIIPGRIISTERNISQVEPIQDYEERRELTDLITERFRGPINFW